MTKVQKGEHTLVEFGKSRVVLLIFLLAQLFQCQLVSTDLQKLEAETGGFHLISNDGTSNVLRERCSLVP